MQNNIIGISLGDPAGIGPEIFLKAFPKIATIKGFLPLLIGDISVISKNLKILDLNYKIKPIKKSVDIDENYLNIYDTKTILNESFPIGKDSKQCGMASFIYIKKSIQLWKQGDIEALVTLPISKKAWHLAGNFYSGHTELLASELNASKYAMIMIAGKIRVLLITTHIPISKVPQVLTKQLITEKLNTSYQFLTDLGIKDPVIAVSALNPHAGEEGIMGEEEEKIIKPAIKSFQKTAKCIGPTPSDTVFKLIIENKVDLVASMYHDQALIPLKTFFFNKLVNYTAGIPMVRTSPGHGTGFDISYSKKANPGSFIEAYKTATYLVKGRRKKT
ncbi:4-hydroxythreonine-4-phosphate dehydrogenase PdxA [bacterium]|nr:4-hydroxythreonine-4-phosphate dehydrogenase PdxA [bacterium]